MNPKVTKAFKLFREMKDGSIAPLFINRKLRLTIGKWYKAEKHVTKGFAVRPGWHCTKKPEAPHLSMKGRAWYEVEIQGADIIIRPQNQGGYWYLGKKMRVIKRTEVSDVRK